MNVAEPMEQRADGELIGEILDLMEELARRPVIRDIGRDGQAWLLLGDACRYWYDKGVQDIRNVIKESGHPPEGFEIVSRMVNRTWIIDMEEALEHINNEMFPFVPPIKFTVSDVKKAGYEAGWEDKDIEKKIQPYLGGGKPMDVLRKVTGKHAKTGGMFGQVKRIKDSLEAEK